MASRACGEVISGVVGTATPLSLADGQPLIYYTSQALSLDSRCNEHGQERGASFKLQRHAFYQRAEPAPHLLRPRAEYIDICSSQIQSRVLYKQFSRPIAVCDSSISL